MNEYHLLVAFYQSHNSPSFLDEAPDPSSNLLPQICMSETPTGRVLANIGGSKDFFNHRGEDPTNFLQSLRQMHMDTDGQ
jgi:hypothetical protein